MRSLPEYQRHAPPKQEAHQGHLARKRFGQNFLIDQGVITAIIKAIAPKTEDAVLEIGPGLGALTAPLLDILPCLSVIEIDRNLAARLKSRYPPNRLNLHEGDVLQADFSTFNKTLGKPLRLIGNLPYNISTPLLFHLTRFANGIVDMHFMLQKEVVDRIVAPVGSSDFSRLSVMMQYYFSCESLIEVPPESFRPAPKVHSAVIRFIPHAQREAKNEKELTALVQRAFSQRRKMLRNTLKDVVSPLQFAALHIDPTCRAEDVSVADYVRISNYLYEAKEGLPILPEMLSR